MLKEQILQEIIKETIRINKERYNINGGNMMKQDIYQAYKYMKKNELIKILEKIKEEKPC